MAIVRRKSHAASTDRARLLKAMAAVAVMLVTCLFLFSMDSFREEQTAKHRNNRKHRATPRLSPDLLLRERNAQKAQNENNNLRGRAANTDATDEEDGSSSMGQNAGGDPNSNDDATRDEEKTQGTSLKRRVAFDLAQLKGDAKGTIVIETNTDWAPLGVQHFWELVESDFYNDVRFFRVLPNFVAQFGISGTPSVQQKYRQEKITDDPVLEKNVRGTLTYAMSGKNTRTTQLFLNLKDNAHLDKEGFAPIGKVVEGMVYLDQIQDEHKQLPKQPQIVQKGNEYLNAEFPNLTYIQEVRILD